MAKPTRWIAAVIYLYNIINITMIDLTHSLTHSLT